MSVKRLVPTCVLCLALATCVEESSGPRSTGPRAEISPTATEVLVGAGDIADCKRIGDSLTANLLDGIPGTVFALGDNAYPSGTDADFANCYDPTWGRHKARTRPVPGNHDYSTSGAAGYFRYFGAAAGDPTKGYYSYDLGAWHIIALNSSKSMDAGSAQDQWLRADLAAHPAACTLAYWHHPLFSSSTVEVHTAARAAWQDLYDAGAELVLNGHHHDYERFAPQTPAGAVDRTFGIREIIVGTGGGEGLFPFGETAPNSEVRNNETFGVLKLTLRARDYDWEFVPVAGKTFRDAGSGTCHDAPGSPPTNHPPTAAAGGPYTGVEGSAVTFDGSGSSDPDGDALLYAWSFGDGATGTGVRPTHSYADNASYTVSLTVTDAPGASSAPASATATIANAAPAVNAPASQTATADSQFTLTARFSDPGANDAPWAYAIDWGDGPPPTTGSTTSQASPLTATHTYAAAGTYTARLSVTDKDGTSGAGETAVTVVATNQSPTAAFAVSCSGLACSFTDASTDPDGRVVAWSWSFGDGSSSSSQNPSHTYGAGGSYTVQLTVTDDRGGTASASRSVTVSQPNRAPSVNAGADATILIGLYTLRATFSDPDNDGPWSYTISWGDGLSEGGSTSSQSNAIGGTHPYLVPGTYRIHVTVVDAHGAAGSDDVVLTVKLLP